MRPVCLISTIGCRRALHSFAPRQAAAPLLQIIVEETGSIGKRPICCQYPLHGGLGILRLMMYGHTLRIWHLHIFYLKCEQVWSPFFSQVFPQFVSLSELQSGIKKTRGRATGICSFARNSLPSTSRPMRLAKNRILRSKDGKGDDIFGKRKGDDKVALIRLFRRNFKLGTNGNFRIPLT